MAFIPHTRLPPGRPGEPFIIPYLEGDVVEFPAGESVVRMLVTGKETNNTFALVEADGSETPPIIFHYHDEAHDIFLCTRGQMNVWADDQARTLNPGDMASVPPGTIHRYQILGTHSQFWGPIVPGDWIEMFYAMGDAFPEQDILYKTPETRDPMATMAPRIRNLIGKHDMTPVPDHPPAEPVFCQPTDNVIPDGAKPYFLKADSGPKFAAAGLLLKPMVGLAQSSNRFAIARVEGSNRVPSKLPKLVYPSNQALTVVEGAFELQVEDCTQVLQTGQTIFIPAGKATTLAAATRYAATYVTCDGVGMPAALEGVGKAYDVPIISEGFDRDPDVSGYTEAFKRLGLQYDPRSAGTPES